MVPYRQLLVFQWRVEIKELQDDVLLPIYLHNSSRSISPGLNMKVAVS